MDEPASRREFQPSQRNKGANPAVVIGTLVALAGAIIFFVVRLMLANQAPAQPDSPPDEISTDTQYSAIKRQITKAMQVKHEADRLKQSEDTAAFKKKCEEAKTALRDVLDALDEMLDPVRDENGELPSAFSAYSQDYQRVNTALHDVVKSSPF